MADVAADAEELDVEVQSAADGAWYASKAEPVASKRGKPPKLHIHFNFFPKEEDEDLEGPADVMERVRFLSHQVQEGECHRIKEGMRVCAKFEQEVGDEDVLVWHDARVIKANYCSGTNTSQGDCECEFTVRWLDGPHKGKKVTLKGSEPLCLLDSRPCAEHPVVKKYLALWEEWEAASRNQKVGAGHAGDQATQQAAAKGKRPLTPNKKQQGSRSTAQHHQQDGQGEAQVEALSLQPNLLPVHLPRKRKAGHDPSFGSWVAAAKNGRGSSVASEKSTAAASPGGARPGGIRKKAGARRDGGSLPAASESASISLGRAAGAALDGGAAAAEALEREREKGAPQHQGAPASGSDRVVNRQRSAPAGTASGREGGGLMDRRPSGGRSMEAAAARAVASVAGGAAGVGNGDTAGERQGGKAVQAAPELKRSASAGGRSSPAAAEAAENRPADGQEGARKRPRVDAESLGSDERPIGALRREVAKIRLHETQSKAGALGKPDKTSSPRAAIVPPPASVQPAARRPASGNGAPAERGERVTPKAAERVERASPKAAAAGLRQDSPSSPDEGQHWGTTGLRRTPSQSKAKEVPGVVGTAGGSPVRSPVLGTQAKAAREKADGKSREGEPRDSPFPFAWRTGASLGEIAVLRRSASQDKSKQVAARPQVGNAGGKGGQAAQPVPARESPGALRQRKEAEAERPALRRMSSQDKGRVGGMGGVSAARDQSLALGRREQQGSLAEAGVGRSNEAHGPQGEKPALRRINSQDRTGTARAKDQVQAAKGVGGAGGEREWETDREREG